MITFRQHISLMESINEEESPDKFIKELKPLDALNFIRSSEKTYPIKENVKKPLPNKIFYLKIESLVLGQFIMLEQIITGKTKLAGHLVDLEIAKLVIRPLSQQVFDNEDSDSEVYNQESILDMDVLEVYWVLDKFIEAREKTLFKDFSGVFYDLKEEDDEEDNFSEEQKTADMLFTQQWYWYSIVRMLSGEDIHRYDETYMLPMSTVLPEMSYLAQKNKIESANQRQSEAMRKL